MGPYGITQVDVPGLLQAREQMQQNRIRALLLQKQIDAEEADANRQKGISAAISRYAQPKGGISETGATQSSAPQVGSGMSGAVGAYGGNIDLSQRPSISNADGSNSTLRSISIGTEQGEVLIPTISPDGRQLTDDEAVQQYRSSGQHLGIYKTPDEATAAGQRLSTRMGQPNARSQGPAPADRERLFVELVAIDHKVAGEVMDAFSKMDETQAKAAKTRNEVLSRAAQHLLAIPPAERGAELQRIAPVLIADGGITQEQLSGFDPTNDRQLQFIVGQSRDIEKIIEATKPKLRNVGVGDVVIDEKTGKPVYESPVVAGPGGEIFARPPAMSGIAKPVTATNPQTGEKIQLNPETGQWEPIQGGQTGSAPSGGFPGN